MYLYGVVILAVTAVGGLVPAVFALKRKQGPLYISIVHGLLGATGLVLVALAVLQGSGGTLGLIGLVLVVGAALGGFFVVSFRFRDLVAPPALVVVHAGVAISGFGCLLGGLLQ